MKVWTDGLAAHNGRSSDETAQAGPPPLWPAIWQDRWVLAVILLVALALRVVNPNWDKNQHLHPDERFISMVADATKWPDSVGQYFNTAESPLNPANKNFGFFVYGTLPLFMGKAIAAPFNWDQYDRLFILGRVLSGIFDTGTVLLVYLIGVTLYGRRVGLLGAAIMALSAHAIQLSHFFAFDTFTVFFTTLTLFFTARIQRGAPFRDFIWLGCAFGAALACKFSVLWLPLSFIPAAAIAVFLPASGTWRPLRGLERALPRTRSWRPELTPTLRLNLGVERAPASMADPRGARNERLIWGLGGLAVTMVVAALVFRVFNPYAFDSKGFFDVKPNPKFIESVDQQRQAVEGIVDYPPSVQYAFTPPFIFPLKDIIVWGLGIPAGLAALFGTLYVTWDTVRRRYWLHLPLLIWVAFNFLYYGRLLAKGMRYFYPIYPILAIFAAFALIRLWDWASTRARENEAAGQRPLLWLRPLAGGALAFVVVGSIVYALAFTSIYLRPMTRLAAAEWIYDNVPPGSVPGNEHWDDPQPLRLPGRNNEQYRGEMMNLYDIDTPQKRDQLLKTLNQIDYIFLTSNRLYGSIPRLPMRYPMTSEYYRLLFGEQLGFHEVAEFKSHPSFLGLTWDDDRGMEVGGLRGLLQPDEAFSVYDHPPVLIYQKGPDYDPARVKQLLEAVSLDAVSPMSPLQAEKAKNMVMLPEDLRQRVEAAGTWRDLFDPASIFNQHPRLSMLLLMELLGSAVFLLLFPLLRPLLDRGYSAAKVLSVVCLAYPVWALAAFRLTPFTRPMLLVALLALIAGGAYVGHRHRREVLHFLRRRWRAVALLEGIFLVGFVGFSFVRASNPDLWHANLGGEKPMDLAYLTAVMKSEWFPAYDPWFAGGVMNYYAYGFILVGALGKLLGIVPSTMYNVAVPLWYGLTALAAAGVGFNLGGLVAREVGGPRRRLVPYLCATLGAAGTVLFGNLGEFALFWDTLYKIGGQTPGLGLPILGGLLQVVRGLVAVAMKPETFAIRNEWFYWNATRVIPEAITEFPFFTFLYGDLHAHMLALPFTLVALGLTVNVAFGLLRRPRLAYAAEPRLGRLVAALRPSGAFGMTSRLGIVATPTMPSSSPTPDPQPPTPNSRAQRPSPLTPLADGLWPLRLGLLALTLAVVWVTNTWDMPTYLGIASLTLGAVAWWRRAPGTPLWVVARDWIIASLALLALTWALAYPFLKDYSAAYGSVQPWKDKHTQPLEFFVVNGLSLSLLTLWALVRFHQRRSWRDDWSWFVGPLVVGAVLWWLGQPLLAFLAPLAALALFGALDPEAGPAERVIHTLFGIGLALAAVPEVIVLTGDVGRMNTVFKLYLQLWCLWALAVALCVPWLLRWAGSFTGDTGLIVRAALVVALGIALLYPIFAAPARAKDRFFPTPPTMNGELFMTQGQWSANNQPIALAPDYAAIQWLRDNVTGTPAIVEASGLPYTWQNRVTMFTGLPGLIGWDNHQRQQRGVLVPEAVEKRLQAVKSIYTDATPERTMELLRRNHVGYVYLGALERAMFGPGAQPKLDNLLGRGLDLVYDKDGVRIYKVQP